jgi:hypothetical protein
MTMVRCFSLLPAMEVCSNEANQATPLQPGGEQGQYHQFRQNFAQISPTVFANFAMAGRFRGRAIIFAVVSGYR